MPLYLGSEKKARVNVTHQYIDGIQLPTLTNPGDTTMLLQGRELIGENGEVIVGTMPNNPAIFVTLDLDNGVFYIPEGYIDGGIIEVDGSISENASTQADLIAEIGETLPAKIGTPDEDLDIDDSDSDVMVNNSANLSKILNAIKEAPDYNVPSISYVEEENETGGTIIYIACKNVPTIEDNTTAALNRAILNTMKLA